MIQRKIFLNVPLASPTILLISSIYSTPDRKGGNTVSFPFFPQSFYPFFFHKNVKPFALSLRNFEMVSSHLFLFSLLTLFVVFFCCSSSVAGLGLLKSQHPLGLWLQHSSQSESGFPLLLSPTPTEDNDDPIQAPFSILATKSFKVSLLPFDHFLKEDFWCNKESQTPTDQRDFGQVLHKGHPLSRTAFQRIKSRRVHPSSFRLPKYKARDISREKAT